MQLNIVTALQIACFSFQKAHWHFCTVLKPLFSLKHHITGGATEKLLPKHPISRSSHRPIAPQHMTTEIQSQEQAATKVGQLWGWVFTGIKENIIHRSQKYKVNYFLRWNFRTCGVKCQELIKLRTFLLVHLEVALKFTAPLCSCLST